jgi:hypothetical protein
VTVVDPRELPPELTGDNPADEVEPRWSPEDRARRDGAVAKHERPGPGVVPARPPEEDPAKERSG